MGVPCLVSIVQKVPFPFYPNLQVGENRWEFPVAITTKGMLWGTIEESRSGQRILAFRGIKYAQPPVGPLRFKPPRPLPQWSGIAGLVTNAFFYVCLFVVRICRTWKDNSMIPLGKRNTEGALHLSGHFLCRC